MPNLVHRSVRRLLIAICLTFAVSGISAQEPEPSATSQPPIHLTSEQDHQRLLDLLHIKELRRGPDGDPKSPDAANFDESKVTPYPPLPGTLRFNDGTKVTTAKEWWTKRRPEIMEIFDREIYGRIPPNTPAVNWETTITTHEEDAGIPTVTKKLVGHVDNSADPQITVDIQLMLVTPANAQGPVPVMMEFGWSPEMLAQIRKHFSEEQWKTMMGTGLATSGTRQRLGLRDFDSHQRPGRQRRRTNPGNHRFGEQRPATQAG